MDSFTRDGLTFPVRDEGPRDGPVVVLLHGFPQTPDAFEDVVPLLTERGLRTLVPTQRGYAASASPSARSAYTTAETTADVVALLDAAGAEQAHVVGHDWGGAPAWAMGAWHPDRVASLTVLSTPHPAAMGKALRSGGQALRSWYMGFFQLPVLPELLVRPTIRLMLEQMGCPSSHARRYAAAMSEPGILSGALGWYRAIPFSRDVPVRRVEVPTTYLWGRRDPALGREAAEGTAHRVGSDYRFVELDEGHWLPERRSREVADAVLERALRSA
ncbi:MAG TPA: alpha/beta fold hydrolase [Dermatophilaceae bacterium]|nr:alpha/beta fold hydrolase [Dermatophilaceae bacterium]